MSAAYRIIAGVSGSPGSLHALRYAADLAHQHAAVLVPCWPGCRRMVTGMSVSTPARSCASSGKTTPGSGCRTPSTLPSAACPPVSPPNPPCCAASPARCSSARPASRATYWSLVPGARARCGGFGAARSAATAWLTPPAQYWPSRPPPWPGMQATACAAGRTGTAGPRPPHSRHSGPRHCRGSDGTLTGSRAQEARQSTRVKSRCRPTATVTATAAANSKHQRPATAHNSRTIRANWGYVRLKSGRSAVRPCP
jgi:hypothetical protein